MTTKTAYPVESPPGVVSARRTTPSQRQEAPLITVAAPTLDPLQRLASSRFRVPVRARQFCNWWVVVVTTSRCTLST